MERESDGLTPGRENDILEKIHYIKDLKKEMDSQWVTMQSARYDLETMYAVLETLAKEVENKHADRGYVSPEEWIELYQKADALEALMVEIQTSINQENIAYQTEVKKSGVDVTMPYGNNGNTIN